MRDESGSATEVPDPAAHLLSPPLPSPHLPDPKPRPRSHRCPCVPRMAPQGVVSLTNRSAEEWVFPWEMPGCSIERLSSRSAGGIVSFGAPSTQPGSPHLTRELQSPRKTHSNSPALPGALHVCTAAQQKPCKLHWKGRPQQQSAQGAVGRAWLSGTHPAALGLRHHLGFWQGCIPLPEHPSCSGAFPFPPPPPLLLQQQLVSCASTRDARSQPVRWDHLELLEPPRKINSPPSLLAPVKPRPSPPTPTAAVSPSARLVPRRCSGRAR